MPISGSLEIAIVTADHFHERAHLRKPEARPAITFRSEEWIEHFADDVGGHSAALVSDPDANVAWCKVHSTLVGARNLSGTDVDPAALRHRVPGVGDKI